MKIVTIVTLVLCSSLVYSQIQNSMPPSPTASSLGRYVDNNVSTFTGTPSIIIPIYEIGLKNHKVPINLQYNPQDIQVGNTASNVGLGWSLNAGGVITRAIKDVQDDWRLDELCNESGREYTTNYPAAFMLGLSFCRWGYLYAISDGEPYNLLNNGYWQGYRGTTTYNLDLESIYENRNAIDPEQAIIENFFAPAWDYVAVSSELVDEASMTYDHNFYQNPCHWAYADQEPDIFYFNFLNYSGKFVFDVENGIPVIQTIPYQDIKFTYQTDDSTGRLIGFTAKDTDGNAYTFQEVEKTQEFIDPPHSGTHTSHFYNSAWWLTKIETPNGEYLNFSYEDEYLVSGEYSEGPYLEVLQKEDASIFTDDYYKRITWTEFQHWSKRLTKIYNNHIVIDFDAEKSREDLTRESDGKAITSITISSKNNSNSNSQRIKRFELEFDYFTGTSDNFGWFYDSDGNYKYYGDKKLRLKSIQELGTLDSDTKPPYSFEYNYYDQGDQSKSHKKFPSLFSHRQDLWGYANGANDNVTSVPSLHIYPDNYEKGDIRMFSVYEKNNYTGRHYVSVGADRIPNSDYADIGVLTKITYPTGGSTTFEYEPHKFNMDGEIFEGGGLRIKQIIKNTGEGELIKYNYKYIR